MIIDLTLALVILVVILVLMTIAHSIGYHRGLMSGLRYAGDEFEWDVDELYEDWKRWTKKK